MRGPSGKYVLQIKMTRCRGAIEKSYEQQGFVWKPQESNVAGSRAWGPGRGSLERDACQRPLLMGEWGGAVEGSRRLSQEAERVVTFMSLSTVIGQILVQNRNCKSLNCSFSGILSYAKPEGAQPALTSHKHDSLSCIPSFLSSSRFNPEK